ncbi:Protein of uncharacterised function (DUF2633) [Edwardsiella hoshinae]|uniref:Protein of uncharacterized function (DUF2633) n=2 Tax=Edwardsiella hoshinae TaxID=93378 RepID=A0A376DJ24_9GAMM|nr:Protein of uncharacterised function (DUF2633) [Edwardsiella hoshinae]
MMTHKMKRRTNIHMTRIVLLISFIILFGRLLYASIGAINHHQDQQRQSLPTEQTHPLSHSDSGPRN